MLHMLSGIIDAYYQDYTILNGKIMKLLIRNLDRKTTDAELKALFQEFATVQSCRIIKDKETGASKGFGFVEIPKIGEAKAAIINLNHKMVGSNKIRVKKADDKNTDEKKPAEKNAEE